MHFTDEVEMKKISQFLVLGFVTFLAFCGGIFAQESRSLLWKISGNGLTSDSYLFGTIHLIPEKDYFVPKGTDSVLALSKKLVMEMDISDPTLQLKMLSAMKLDSGKTLANYFDEKTYAKLNKKLEKDFGFTLATFNTMKPMMVQQAILMKDMMGGGYKSYEKEFLTQAEKLNLSIVGLETLEDQLGAINSMPIEEQVESLKESINSPQKGKKSLEKMIATYKQQDIDKLYESVSGKDADLKKYEDALLINRNRNWIPKISTLAAEGPVFVAVGAAHLGGEQGVISLLRKAGFTVQPI